MARLSGHRDPAGPGRMLELAMAALGFDLHPAVSPKPTEQVADFHALMLSGPTTSGQHAAGDHGGPDDTTEFKGFDPSFPFMGSRLNRATQSTESGYPAL